MTETALFRAVLTNKQTIMKPVIISILFLATMIGLFIVSLYYTHIIGAMLGMAGSGAALITVVETIKEYIKYRKI